MSKSNLYTVRLRMLGGLHLARGKSDFVTGFDLLHSDTLKSAMLVAAAQIHDQPESLGRAWLEDFNVSSGFYYWIDPQTKEVEYFFPKPAISSVDFRYTPLGKAYSETEKHNAKLNRGLEFVGRSYMEKICRGEIPTANQQQLSEDGRFLSDTWGNASAPKTGNQPKQQSDKKDLFLYKEVVEQRVTIPRGGTEDAEPYFIERRFFRDNTGVFFLLECDNADKLQELKICLNVLGEQGIGLDRSTGNGQFEVLPIERFDWPDVVGAGHQYALSLFCPAQETLETNGFLQESYYKLVKRGGWITSSSDGKNLGSYRKKSIYMFAEGAVFPYAQGVKLEGTIVNTRPQVALEGHEILRDGRAIFLPFTLQNHP